MKALIGTSGVLAVQGVATLPTDGTPIVEIVKIVVQLIIGAGTLFQMFRKPKEVKSNQNSQN